MHGRFNTAPAVEDLLHVTVSHHGRDTVLCALAGEIDAATGPRLQHALTHLVRRTPARLVIDVTEVEFLASIGLGVFTELHRVQQAAGHHLAIVVGHDNYAVTRPLQITGLDQSLDLHTDLTTAIAADCTRTRLDP
jgi:anti-anti-sigma factor